MLITTHDENKKIKKNKQAYKTSHMSWTKLASNMCIHLRSVLSFSPYDESLPNRIKGSMNERVNRLGLKIKKSVSP